MSQKQSIVTGIHHVTSCVGGAQEDIDFLTQIIGQRKIKQTVLFDGVTPIYHLYYANRDAEIGTVMTTFPYKQAGIFGRRGTGQVATTVYSVPVGSLDFWVNHLNKHNIKHSGLQRRFGQDLIRFSHPAGLEFEVVGDDRDRRAGWETEEISELDSVKGFNSVVMSVRDIQAQHDYFTAGLGFTKSGEEGRFHRYDIQGGGPCKTVFLRHDPEVAQGSWTFGAGTVHHVAFAVANDADQLELKLHLEGIGYTDVSEQKDRNYFHSVYARSPGGVLNEFATCDIGFSTDEPADTLGQQLMLPPWFENRRAEIIAPLEPITVPQTR